MQDYMREDQIMAKEKYRSVDIEVITFDAADIIVTSGGDEEGNNNEGPVK